MSFLKSYLATLLAILTTSVIVVVLVILIIAGLNKDSKVEIADQTILHIELNGELRDQKCEKGILFSKEECLSIPELESILNIAKGDARIKGVYLEIKDVHAGIATWERLRTSLEKFKKSGKKVISYADNYTLLPYYVASVSDEIVLHPMGYVEWKGLSAQLLYFKSMLDAIGVKAEPVKVGKYKSAIEPFVSDTMSSDNEFQIRALIDDLWKKIKSDVAANRKVPVQKLDEIADSLGILMASEAITQKLITRTSYSAEMLNLIKTSLGDVTLLSAQEYFKATKEDENVATEKIAVVYAEGVISGNEDSEEISPLKYEKVFEEISNDDNIKGVVVRINSPGGSASVSESIWQQIIKLKKKVPVYVSMGEVAASGGYYIASAADSIFSEQTTITGSIGVYGLMFNLEALKNKIGITVEKVKTNHLSDFPSFDRPLNSFEKARLQMGVDSIYQVFLKRVASSRKKSLGEIHELAQGRVYTGNQALSLGLIDGINSLHEVVHKMAKRKQLSKFQIVEYPVPESPLEKITKKIDNKVELQLPEPFSYVNELGQYLKICQDFNQPRCQLPFILTIK